MRIAIELLVLYEVILLCVRITASEPIAKMAILLLNDKALTRRSLTIESWVKLVFCMWLIFFGQDTTGLLGLGLYYPERQELSKIHQTKKCCIV